MKGKIDELSIEELDQSLDESKENCGKSGSRR